MALAAGLVVLAVIAWAFSGAVDASGAAGGTAGGGTAGGAGAAHGHGTKTGTAGPAAGRAGGASGAGLVSAPGTRSAPRSGPGSGRGRGSASRPSPGNGSRPRRGQGSGSAKGPASGARAGSGPATRAQAWLSASAQPPASPAGQVVGRNQGSGGTVTQPGGSAPRMRRACKPGDVVLSLFASQDSYGQSRLPQFEVDVVSTSRRTCAFNVGPRFLAVVATAAGKRVWNSARCVAGRGSLVTDLAWGVPTIIPVTWDLETPVAGCRQAARRAPPGGYAVSASDDGRTSNSLTFTVG